MTLAKHTENEKAALLSACPFCDARTGDWCQNVVGPKRGRIARFLHAVRFKRALREGRLVRKGLHGGYALVERDRKQHSRDGSVRCDICAPLRCSGAT